MVLFNPVIGDPEAGSPTRWARVSPRSRGGGASYTPCRAVPKEDEDGTVSFAFESLMHRSSPLVYRGCFTPTTSSRNSPTGCTCSCTTTYGDELPDVV